MRIILLLSLLTAFPALSMDMYLPALPTIQQNWNVSMVLTNMTLSIFMITSAIMVLIYGPLSDRLGRRPVLLTGLGLFFSGSIACAFAPGVHELIMARALQAAGAGSATALTMAIARDLFMGAERQRVLGYVGVIFALVPMLAPSIGGFMLAFASWRWIFGVQAMLCLIGIVSVYRLQEPLKQRTTGGALAVAKRYITLFKNKDFVALTCIFTLMAVPLFAYIGSASEIYINGFGLTPQTFGIHFGIIAAGIMTGSMFSAKTAGKLTHYQLLAISMSGLLICSSALFFINPTTPYMLTPIMLGIMFCVGINRPLSMHMVLEAIDSDAGAASSVLTFAIMGTGALTMALIAMDWGPRIPMLAIFMLVGTVVPIIGLVTRKLLMQDSSN